MYSDDVSQLLRYDPLTTGSSTRWIKNLNSFHKSKRMSKIRYVSCSGALLPLTYITTLIFTSLFQLELRKKQFHVLLSTIQELQQTLESESGHVWSGSMRLLLKEMKYLETEYSSMHLLFPVYYLKYGS